VPNAEQATHWNQSAGPRWAELAERTDRLFGAVTSALLKFAEPQDGEAVIDIGCGCGVTSLAVARVVGSNGSVLGVDFSAPMLAVAERRARDAGLSNVRFVEADASTYAFDPQRFDLLVSQLGVMFFDEPVRAFAHLYGALRPGGRLRVACFRSLIENDWFSVPLAAARKVVSVPPPDDPTAPGPTSLADPDHLRTVLRAAGFGSIELRPLNVLLPAGTRAEAVQLFARVGSLSRALAGTNDDQRAAVSAALEEALRDYESAGEVELGASLWLVSARA
jgi:SAM-dependent methyltransferase